MNDVIDFLTIPVSLVGFYCLVRLILIAENWRKTMRRGSIFQREDVKRYRRKKRWETGTWHQGI